MKYNFAKTINDCKKFYSLGIIRGARSFKKYLKFIIFAASRSFRVESSFVNMKHEPDKEKVVAIVACYNQLEYTKQCIDSYYAAADDSYQYILIVLDDCSEDATKDFFMREGKKMPNFSYVRFKRNKGLTRSWNYGIWLALEKLKAEYVFIANSDTLIPKNALSRMTKTLKRKEHPGLIGPLTNCPGYNKGQDICNFFPGYSPSSKIEDIQETQDSIENNAPIDWGMLNGFFFGGRRKAFEKNLYAKLFRPYYFDPGKLNYDNEAEFQERLEKKKIKNILALDAFIFHYKDVSQEGKSVHKTYRDDLGADKNIQCDP